MSKPEDIAAFPYSVEIRGPQDDPFDEGEPVPAGMTRIHTFGGMSLRDYFAAKAMQGIASTERGMSTEASMVAISAYQVADAMLEARSKA
jgi:hypothetical protein